MRPSYKIVPHLNGFRVRECRYDGSIHYHPSNREVSYWEAWAIKQYRYYYDMLSWKLGFYDMELVYEK